VSDVVVESMLSSSTWICNLSRGQSREAIDDRSRVITYFSL
jgi:hypothetical protein